jgi:hypothetical protein
MTAGRITLDPEAIERLRCSGPDLPFPEGLGERERTTFRVLAILAERSVAANGGALLTVDSLALGLVAESVVLASDAVRRADPEAEELVQLARDLARDFWIELRPPLLPETVRA